LWQMAGHLDKRGSGGTRRPAEMPAKRLTAGPGGYARGRRARQEVVASTSRLTDWTNHKPSGRVTSSAAPEFPTTFLTEATHGQVGKDHATRKCRRFLCYGT
jgi:hypothetical protein